MAPQRYFTVEQAEALLPSLEKVMSNIRELKKRVDVKLNAAREDLPEDPTELVVTKGQLDFLISEINEQLRTVYNMGCLPKDLDLGLVDFPARIEGKEGYLCWKSGEKRIEYWHDLTEGYRGRKPLGSPSRRP